MACSRSPAGKTLPAGSTVLALGDSLTFGYGAPPGAGFPEILAQLSGWNVINGGVNGDKSADALRRLPPLLAQYKPQLVMTGIGGNDFLRREPTRVTRDNLSAIADTVARQNIGQILIAQPQVSTGALITGRLSDHPLYAEVAAEKNIALFAGAWSDILSDKKLKSDQIHANGRGYRQFAEKLYLFLQKQGWAA